MKGRVIMHISPKQMLFIVIYLVANCLLAGFLWLVRENTLGIPVLNYHQINDTDHNAMTVTTEEFEREMAYLEANGYHAITPDQLVSYLHGGNKLPDKPVLITFDDGYEDNYLNAYPILKKHGFTATIFLISDYMGRFDKYLQWYQVKEMSADGFYMGCHTPFGQAGCMGECTGKYRTVVCLRVCSASHCASLFPASREGGLLGLFIIGGLPVPGLLVGAGF